MKDLEKKTDEKKGAKEYSLVAQIIASLWIASWNSVQFIRELKFGIHIDISDILFSGLAIAGCFAPVYVSIIFDKIKELKNFNKE